MEEHNLSSIRGSLLVLDRIFNKNTTNYRVVGSLLVAALNGKPHRTLNDIDILLDKSKYDSVISNLESEGYQIVKKQKFGFKWTEADHKINLGFTFLLVGIFENEYFSCNLSQFITLRISNRYLNSTSYKLYGIKFIGIPISSVYEGLKISNLNPKRTLDRKIVEKYFNNKQDYEKLDRAFTVFIFGIPFPFLYNLFSFFYNLFGGLRVLFGKKYEVWD
ncbi:hypothetical protein HYT02_05430 [Candidatus Gottesmanbacteria bacterium]|nr:hypothetical protein [Candidatus Gottesmanbacteria bacterium]